RLCRVRPQRQPSRRGENDESPPGARGFPHRPGRDPPGAGRDPGAVSGEDVGMQPPVDTNDLDVALARAADGLRRAGRVAALTGAGVSAESGLATFRGGGGLWEGHAVEDVATPEGFRRNPELVWR